jgi:hypothetical protein
MSIVDWEREGGISGFDIECDECKQSEFYDDDRFRDFIDHAKKDGWKITKDNVGDWMHICPTCRVKEEGR